MTPRALLFRELQEKVAKPLERAGFVLAGRPPFLRRHRGDFVDTVTFAIRSDDEEDRCQFTTSWSVTSDRFAAKYHETWGRNPDSPFIASSQDWLLSGWPRSSLGFRLLNEAERCTQEMREFVQAAETVGAPFLDSISSFEAAAEFWLGRDENAGLCAELLVLAGQPHRAQRLLEATIIEIDQRNLSGRAIALAYFNELHARLFRGSEA